MMDFGYKAHILRHLLNRNCNVTVVPAHTTAEEILAINPDGVMLTNGPGNPEENTEHMMFLQKFINSFFATEIGRHLTPFPYNVTFHPTLWRFKVITISTV